MYSNHDVLFYFIQISHALIKNSETFTIGPGKYNPSNTDPKITPKEDRLLEVIRGHINTRALGWKIT